MKTTRTLAFLSAACLALSGSGAALAPLPACAYMTPAADTQSGVLEGMKYTIQYGYCMITGYTDALPADLTIPAEINGVKVTRIDINAFSDCKTLRSVTLPDSVKEIGFGCFSNCTELAEISFPKKIEDFGQHAVYGTKWLSDRQAKGEPVIAANVLVNGTACTGDVTVPDGITDIAVQAFYQNDKLTGITLPSSLKKIGSWAFEECTGLKTLTVPGNVEEIDRGAFRSCTALESVRLEDGIEEVDDEAFASCDALTSISLPETLRRVSASFKKCAALKEVTIPEGIKVVDSEAFTECPKLESVTVLGYYTYLSDRDWNAVAFSNTGYWADKFTFTGTIKGYNGSFTQDYAEHFQLKFESLGDAPTAGKCGPEMNWTFSGSALTVDGSGEMNNYSGLSMFNGTYDDPQCYQDVAPWFMHRDSIKEVTVGADAAEIASGAFADMTAMESITFLNPETVIPFGRFTISTGKNDEGKRYYGGVIRGYADSTAQEYAEKYDLRFAVIEGAPAVTTTTSAVTTTESGTTTSKTAGTTTAKTVGTTTAKTVGTTTAKTVGTTTAKTVGTTTAKTVGTTTAKTVGTTTAKTVGTTTAKTVGTTTAKTVGTTTAKTVGTTTQLETRTVIPVTTTAKAGSAENGTTGTTTTPTTPPTTMGMTTTAFTTTVVSTSAPDDTLRGKCGESATWAFNIVLEKLTIDGEGKMENYDLENENEAPWFDYGIADGAYVQRIRSIQIENGITGIGDSAFACCWSVKDVVVPASVGSIGKNAFFNCGALESVTILDKDCEIADNEWTICSGIKDNHAFYTGKIIGFPDSTAQKYAEKYGYKFEALDFGPESIYPVEGMIVNIKLVPYLHADGYTAEEQAAYQQQADDFMKKVAKITLTGDIPVENAEDPNLTDVLYDETVTLADDPAVIAKLSAYDSEPLLSAVMPQAESDTASAAACKVSFLDEKGNPLLEIEPKVYGMVYSGSFPVYFDKGMCVLDMSKMFSADSAAITVLTSKSIGTEYEQADYDCPTVLGDLDGSNDISVSDAQLALKAYTEQVAGKGSGLDKGQTIAADVNRDKEVSVEDAQLILKYYTEKNVAGKNIGWKDIVNPGTDVQRVQKLSFRQVPSEQAADDKNLEAFWMDLSQKKDFVFDGSLLELEIKVADDAPDGLYPVEICYADFSDYNARELKNIDTVKGYVCVNKDAPKAEKPGENMTLSVGTASAKPGETVRLTVRVDNNPGMVGFVIRLHCDNSKLTVSRAAAGSDLAKLASETAYTLEDAE